jgi:signal transduction histidine kinase
LAAIRKNASGETQAHSSLRLHSLPSWTGIGLAIVKEFVEAQQGRVWAESRVGEGSTFSVELREAA